MAQLEVSQILRRIGRLVRHEQVILSILAVVIGLIGGGCAIVFREGISMVQLASFGFASERVHTLAAALPWWHILLVTTGGGLVVGLMVRFLLPGRRPEGVADVIAAGALRGGRMPLRNGLAVALVSAVSLGTGASTGREGPVVHLGATMSSFVAEKLHLGRALSRTLLACGVATAVSASFNAPIAGVFFALEVVLGHYSLSAFAPVVIASVTGTVFSRIHFGDFPAFILPVSDITSFFEFPAFAMLGIVSAIVAVAFIRMVALVTVVIGDTPIPTWLRPAIGGLLVGLIALFFPQVLGVGYEATDMALNGQLALHMLLILLFAKALATATCLGCGFGGGVFSPSLFLGAMTGGAFGVIATSAFPELSSGHTAYTLIGMGAVAGAVLGAPISTILIVFELTGNYALTIAVMVATVLASVVTRYLHGESFFHWQLAARGISLEGAREQRLLETINVSDIMRKDYVAVDPAAPMAEVRRQLMRSHHGTVFVIDGDGVLHGTITLGDLADTAFDTSIDVLLNAQDVTHLHPLALDVDDDLGKAFRLMEGEDEDHVPVVENHETMEIVGIVHQRDVMHAHSRAILTGRESSGEDR
ncbi:MAG: chloride channel protein [Alphaproteobacteria bacterium]|nr:chloride channel protein [Alphaproteobacteria bacterium]